MKSKIIIIFSLFILIGGVLWVILSQQRSGTNSVGSLIDFPNLPEAQSAKTIELNNGDTYDLTAAFVKKSINGQEVRMLAYNSSIPGPIIKVRQGSEVTVNFTNDTDMKTLLHSHGVRMDNAFDGSQVTQEEMEPGETFEYKLKFPDAGVYWYHPHIREDYAQELGLYGNFLVEPNDPGYWNPVNRELALFFDDIYLEDGKINLSKTGADHTLMGRFGTVMLVNGETDYQLNVDMNEVVRLYLTNAANTRTFHISIPGVNMKLVGGDNGKYERETIVQSLVLGPSERAIVEVLFDLPGSYTMKHASVQKSYQLAAIRVSDNPPEQQFENGFNSMRTNQDVMTDIDAVRAEFEKPADKSLRLAVAMKSPMGGMSSGSGQHMMHGGMMMENSMMGMGTPQPIEWEDDMGMMNSDSTTETLAWQMIDEQTGKANMKIDDWKFKVGDRIKIAVFNDPNSMHPMQHPIHIHGQRFLVLSTNGVKSDNLAWKDTALIKTGDAVEFLVEMSNPGTWMIHCHIAEHLEAGMMMKFEVDV